ncbi:MAG: hypothetical protein U9N43_04420 [Euryarchaeota archaeon]|nr:hypothetical protein [Euryarchaeota archaeon]
MKEGQQGEKRAGYGKRLIADRSQRLAERHEKMFSLANPQGVPEGYMISQEKKCLEREALLP